MANVANVAKDLRLEVEAQGITVRFTYDAHWVRALKEIGGGRWQPDMGAWIFPSGKLAALEDLKFKLEHPLAHLENRSQYDQRTLPVEAFAAQGPNAHWVRALEERLTLKGYSGNTIKSYASHLNRFLTYTQGTCDDHSVRAYLLDLLEIKACSHTHVNQAINAIKHYLLLRGMPCSLEDIAIPRPKREQKLPKVMSKAEVQDLVGACHNLKHKTALMVAYSCGMRVGEVANLKLKDIDYSRAMILVYQGKGRKDRMVPMANRLSQQLDQYLRVYRPLVYVFENPTASGPITERTLQVVFNKAKEAANIKKDITFHSLRHSYATHLLESGVDLRYIQELLGHKNSKTTEIYTHVTQTSLQKITNPLDQLDL